MASIQDLLNPLPDIPKRQFSGFYARVEPPVPATTHSFPVRHKRPKMAKDGPVFRPGRIQGELRYPPCEERDEQLAKIHREFHLHPIGKIADYPRHIPYQSDKKSFQEKTGRDSFHVFQYTFQIPGEDNVWTVMWDYNIGLVRTTHLFKCNDYSKTTPGRVLNQNPGLRDICHSITGGALAAQGYWMPFEAAKAVAATFCWKIRYILTPLFGTDFPSQCIPPQDRARFGRMIIDSAIVRQATETANRYRSLELQGITTGSDNVSFTNSPPSPPNKREETRLPSLYTDRDLRQMVPKFHRRSYEDSISSARGSSSEPFCVSPRSPTRSGWTPVNDPPRSSEIAPRARVPSPQHFYAHVTALRKKHLSGRIDEDSESGTDMSSGSRSDVIRTPEFPAIDSNEDVEMAEGRSDAADVDSNGSPSDVSDSDDEMVNDDEDEEYRVSTSRLASGNKTPDEKDMPKKNPSRSAKGRDGGSVPAPGHFAHEVRAAHALLRLHMQEATSDDPEGESSTVEPSWGPTLGLGSRLSINPGTRKRRRASL